MNKFTALLFALFLFVFPNKSFCQSIAINEVLSSNTTVNTDEDNSYQDWVELYNYGATAVDLNGFGLSDDGTLLYKWTFPAVTLNAGEYLLVWCSDKNRIIPGSPLHTNFKISAGGEAIYLTNLSGTAVSTFPATAIPANISYGKIPNGTGGYLFLNPASPGQSNGTVGYTEILNPPTFSQNSGFLTAAFNLTLSTTTPGATILYTLDGSEPKASNLGGTTYSYKNQYPFLPGQLTGPLLNQSFTTLQYSAPIPIVDRTPQPNKISAISTTYHFTPFYIPTSPVFKGTAVRAKIIKPGALDSPTVTETYYISPQGTAKYSMPVVSISIDENKLFDYNDGILVAGVDFDNWRIANPTETTAPTIGNVANFFRKGMDHERRVNFTYFVNGLEVLNHDVGLRVHGGSSRVAQNKSFTFYARSDYGDDTMSYKFFADKPYETFYKLNLHNSGNDYNQTMFRDAFCQELSKSLNFTTKGYQPSIVFINGEYWGILGIRDKIDDHYFTELYGIPTSEIQVLENAEEAYFPVEGGDNSDYLNLIAYLADNSLASQANYDYIKTRIDPESFKDYFITNIFLENTDWPANNIYYWRKNTAAYIPDAPYGHDGRWRWMAHDMDDTFSISSQNINLNSLAAATAPNGPEFPNPPWSTLLLRRMLENDSFKIDFINRFADLLNTSFLTSRMLSKMAEMKAVLDPEAPGQFARWSAPEDNGDWNYFLNIQTDFINQRPAFQRNHIRGQFNIASNINATLDVSDPSHGYIKMNTIDVKVGTDGITSNPYPWTGIYFSNIPVKLKAIPNPGFAFSHWTGSSTSTDPEITITSATNFSVTAVFVEDNVGISQPIYFWMMNSAIPNNLPLETLNTSFKAGTVDGVIQYQSCLIGYPFTATNPLWRKASMERRNSPTDLNYIPEANNNLPFATSDMKGLQIKEPFEHSDGQGGTLDNTLIFNIPTTGYKDIKFSFAGINELTNATAINLDYSLNSGTPIFQVTTSFPLTSAYQLFNYDLSTIVGANNNPDFKIRIRFTGTNMTVDTGARITFNNIAVHGTPIALAVVENDAPKFSVFPNPFSDNINIIGLNKVQVVSYEVFSVDGKLIKTGVLENAQINLNKLSKGMYLIRLSSEGKTETKKIIKR